jgi:hypothetical protein
LIGMPCLASSQSQPVTSTGPPSKIVLTVDQIQPWTAGQLITMHATVTDAAGVGVPQQTVFFMDSNGYDFGSGSSLTDSSGTCSLQHALPATITCASYYVYAQVIQSPVLNSNHVGCAVPGPCSSYGNVITYTSLNVASSVAPNIPFSVSLLLQYALTPTVRKPLPNVPVTITKNGNAWASGTTDVNGVFAQNDTLPPNSSATYQGNFGGGTYSTAVTVTSSVAAAIVLALSAGLLIYAWGK